MHPLPSTPLPWTEIPIGPEGQMNERDRACALHAVNAHRDLLDFVSDCRWITPDKINHLTSDAADLFRKYR